MDGSMHIPGPRAVYDARIADGSLRPDEGQAEAVVWLDDLFQALDGYDPNATRGFAGLFKKKMEAPKGLYLWGGVGRGKSMLMDLFFDEAPLAAKRRVHFHAFMAEIHDGLQEARATGVKDPIQVVADSVVAEATLLCFDELQITDIADAMIVGRLFDKLFAAGVVVVTTSNRHPDDLYKDGLNRKLFLPFIDLIKERLDVRELVSPTDHRRRALEDRPLYFSPLGEEATALMDRLWSRLAGGRGAPLVLRNKGREVILPRYLNGVGRGTFEDLCAQAYGPSDYLLIADNVAVLMIDDIPVLSRRRSNEAKRFVTLIDALYEAKKRLISSAAAEPESLYEEGPGAFEFERTASRIIEMRRPDWGAPLSDA